MTEEKIRGRITEEDLLKCLSGNYTAIYYVDFDEDLVIPYRLSEDIKEAFSEIENEKLKYSETIISYIDKIVSEKDRDQMYEITRYAFLKEQLKDQLAYSHEYRLERDGIEKYFRFKVVNLEGVGELHRAVLGYADVSSEKNTEYSFYTSGRKVLIVEDKKKYRDKLSGILDKKYEVLTAKNGREALEVLADNYHNIAVVMADLNMPVMDGRELIKNMKRVRQYSNIPIIVSSGSYTENNKSGIEVTCLELGASDFILKPYNPDIVLNRVKSFIQLRESTALLNTLEKDTLTGLYTKEFFFNKADEYILSHPEEKLCMMVTDIFGLKIINEKYGYKVGNEILKILAREEPAKVRNILFSGRIEGDKIASLVSVGEDFFVYKNEIMPDMGIDFPIPGVVLKNAVYFVKENDSLTSRSMYDRAIIGIQKIKYKYGVYITEYDDTLRKDLMRERQITESSWKAVRDEEFEIFYQPKVDVKSEGTSGAEALVRWNNSELGFLSPAKFISIFEQTGFITTLDFYVWEKVCRTQKRWKDEGRQLVPISINISRRDFDDSNLAEKLIAIADKYNLDHSLLHIEITESAYSDNLDAIKETIGKLHDAGFEIELDDFGSGYSSMQALSILPLDVMKLDMSLIRNDDPDSEKNVLKFSMQLAKLMGLKTVAEGVENEEQVKRIVDLGGDYIQGYYYSKPLPEKEFEKYL